MCHFFEIYSEDIDKNKFTGIIICNDVLEVYMKKLCLSFFLLFGLIVSLYAQNNQQTLPRYTAREYINLWRDNKLKAEQLYKGKQMEITGAVLKVDRTVFGDVPYVDLNVDNPLGGLTCEFPESAINSIVDLEKGQTVVIIGYAESQFRLKKCSIKR
jgi:hypothetical protein